MKSNNSTNKGRRSQELSMALDIHYNRIYFSKLFVTKYNVMQKGIHIALEAGSWFIYLERTRRSKRLKEHRGAFLISHHKYLCVQLASYFSYQHNNDLKSLKFTIIETEEPDKFLLVPQEAPKKKLNDSLDFMDCKKLTKKKAAAIIEDYKKSDFIGRIKTRTVLISEVKMKLSTPVI